MRPSYFSEVRFEPLTLPLRPCKIKTSSRKLDRHTPFSLSFLNIKQESGRSQRAARFPVLFYSFLWIYCFSINNH